MKLIPYVLAVLFLMGLLTVTSVRQTLVHHAGERSYAGMVNAMRLERNNYDEIRYHQPSPIKRPSSKPQPKPDKNVSEDPDEDAPAENRWRFTRYDTLLDLNQLHLHTSQSGNAGVVDHYTVFLRLMRNLYGNQPWWHEGLDQQIVNALIPKLDGKLTSPDAIASIDLNNPELQQYFYRMLKGGNNIPSLLDYLTVDQANRPQPINMFHAPEPLLAALFDSPEKAAQLVAKRTEMITEMEKRQAAISTAERNRTLQTGMANLMLQLGINRATFHKQLLEVTVTPRRSKYRYVTIEGVDPLTHIAVKQRIRIELK